MSLLATMSTSAAGGWVASTAIASVGPTPFVLIKCWNVIRSSFARNPNSDSRGFGDVVVDVEEGLGAGLEFGQRPLGHVDPVADTGHLDERRPVEVAIEHLAAQRPDHRAAA